ncbi:hypothetical protein D6779_09140 [Candidatus Parcubacteria bacterium]|nr:MAG: hypothetical protein D6779_09140 [Candidatus Parcubacteria bacterium]
MSEVNFVRDGWIGCPVWEPRYGNGTIIRIDTNSDSPYPILVKFDSGLRISFRSNGKEERRHIYPSLCYGHREPLDQGTPPSSPPEPLNFTGKPVVAWVGDAPYDWKSRVKRTVVARLNTGHFLGVCGYVTDASGWQKWKYAWEIEKRDEEVFDED